MGLLERIEKTGQPKIALVAKPRHSLPPYIIGDEPITKGMPGEIVMSIPGLNNEKQFLHAIRKEGIIIGGEIVALRPLINKLRDEKKHVGISWSMHKIRIYTASHKREIIGGVAAVGITTAVAGVIYFVKRSPRNHKEK